MIGSGSAFNRSIATYSPVDGAPFSVANSEESPVILTSDAVASGEQSTETRAATPEDEASGDDSLLDADPSLPTLGDVGVLELGIGASIALVGGGLLLLLRR